MMPRTNSRSVRPREIEAMNEATNGENAKHQQKMNTDHAPFQLSAQVDKLPTDDASMNVLIGTNV